jgi:2'-hydroxyisoflavone reductase
VGRYVFVSSISVYDDFSAPVTEASRVAELEDPATEEILENYGALKAACERVVEEVYGDRSARVRAGLIVGPYDATDRFTYWPRRIALGGDVLGPGDPNAPVQFIDARDLAAWLVQLALEGPGGTFNATGPPQPLTFAQLLDDMRVAIGSDADVVWLNDERVLDAGVQPWTELPLWLPGSEYAGMARADISRALAAGLTFRPVGETVVDTLAWDRTEPGDRPTLSRDKEQEILAAR